MVVVIAALAGLSVAAGAAGLFVGSRLVSATPNEPPPKTEAAAAVAPKVTEGVALQELPPVVTTLAEPPDTWIRLQASIVYDAKQVPKPDVLAAEVASDTMGFLKTLSAAQIGGPSGLLHLREDLSERAQTRSDGHVREFIIQTMVVQ